MERVAECDPLSRWPRGRGLNARKGGIHPNPGHLSARRALHLSRSIGRKYKGCPTRIALRVLGLPDQLFPEGVSLLAFLTGHPPLLTLRTPLPLPVRDPLPVPGLHRLPL